MQQKLPHVSTLVSRLANNLKRIGLNAKRNVLYYAKEVPSNFQYKHATKQIQKHHVKHDHRVSCELEDGIAARMFTGRCLRVDYFLNY